MPDQELDFPFAGGIDEKTHADLVEPGAALVVSNLTQVKNGTYEKRSGHAAFVSGTGTVPVGKRLLPYRNELLQTDGLNLWSYSETEEAWNKAAGLAPQLLVTSQSKMGLDQGAQSYDCAVCNGYVVVAVSVPADSSTNPAYKTYATVFDAVSGVVVVAPSICISGGSTSGTGPPLTLLSVGTKVICLQAADNATSTNINASYIDLASKTTILAGWQGLGAFITDTTNFVDGYHAFDACSLGNLAGVPQFAVVYLANTQKVKVRRFNDSLVSQASVVFNAVTGDNPYPKAVAIDGDMSDVIFVAYGIDGDVNVNVIGLDPTTLATTATTQAILTTPATTTVNVLAVTRTGTGTGIAIGTSGLDTNQRTPDTFTRNFHVAAGAVVATDSSQLKSPRALVDSRPFMFGGRVYCTMRSFFGAPNDLYIVDLTQSMADRHSSTAQGYSRVAGSVTPRLAFLAGGEVGFSPAYSAQAYVSPRRHVPILSSTVRISTSVSLQSATSSSLDLVSMDWASPNLAQASPLGEDLAMSGSPTSFYDGVRSAEIGFCEVPHGLFNSLSGSGLTGIYKYVVVFEQVDLHGQWHQSAPSAPMVVDLSSGTGTPNSGVDVTCFPLVFSNRADILGPAAPLRVVLYRTAADGNVFFRVPAGVVTNDPIAAVVFPHDETPDTSLGAPLYTQPGVPNTAQVRVAPPGFSSMTINGDRLFGAVGKNVWFSGVSTYGEGYWFADLFQFVVEKGSGDITALASLDGALVIFKRDAIAFVDGQGPPDNGAGGDFSPPQFVAADVGCVEPRSVVVTSAGILFQSLRGIELLTRSRSLENYFGSRVEASLAANPVITSAVLDEARGLVTFTCLPTETSTTGITLVWDYVHLLWTTGAVLGGTAVKSAILWGQGPGTTPIHTKLTFDGKVFQEASSYLDAGVFVASTIQSPWLKMAGLQGYGRTRYVSLLVDPRTPSDVTISVEVDYRSGAVQTRTFTAAEIEGLLSKQLPLTIKEQKCESIRFTFTEATPTGGPAVGTGRGATFIGFRVEYAQKAGVNRMRNG